jgi:uncharacterized protein
MASIPQQSALEVALNYDSIPLSKRLAMQGTTKMTKNSVQTEVNWGAEINRVDPHSGYTPLMVAGINGNPESVKTLIDRGAIVDYKEPTKGRTALICACKKGNPDAVSMLLHKGATLSVVDNNGMYPLMWASKNGHLSCCKLLIEHGAGINAFDSNAWTAIHFAAKYGHREVVEFLAHSGASIVLKEKLEEGKTPLMLAAQYGRRDTCICLMERGSDVNAVTTRDELTALMLAAKEGHKGTVRCLLSYDADANMSDSYGWTSLHFTSSWGRKETARLLIREGGANVNAMPIKKKSGGGGTTPLIIASKGQQVDMINILLDHGADPSINDAASGKNPLAIAAQEGFTASVEALIDHDVDLNVRDSRHMTPLMLAVVGGHAETIRLLLAACADITLLDLEGKSALSHSRDFEREDVYLKAILKSSAAGKATVIPWIEMDVPKMIRGSICGGPSVFLNDILYQKDGLFAGLFLRKPEQDVHLIHDLTMLLAAMARSRYTQPLDADDLNNKINEIDDMLLSIMDTRSFCIDHNLSLALSLKSYPEAMQNDGGYDYKYYSNAFTSGPLGLYIENNLSKWLTSYQMTRMINELFISCTRNCGKVNDKSYGKRTYYLRLRYCPAVMFIMEGISKFIFLILVTLNIQSHRINPSISTTASGSGAAGNSGIEWLLSDKQLEQLLMVWIITTIIYELGAIEEKAWAVSPSIAVDPQELKQNRRNSMLNHFFCDIWHKFDGITLLLTTTWLTLKYINYSNNVFMHTLLSLTPIPLSIGLLRYPGAFYRQFGQLVLSIFIITEKLLNFLLIFIATGAGFGIAFTGLFYETGLFSTPFMTFRTLFDAMNHNYELQSFDSITTQSPKLGIILLVIFILWTVIVLFNIIVAYIASIYSHVNEQAEQNWLLIKAKHLQQFLLVHEKSPLCMLPAPLNTIPSILYPMHQIYTWRARLYMDKGVETAVSMSGSVTDLLLKFLFFIPAVIGEYFGYISDLNERKDERYTAIITAPFELFSCSMFLLYKIWNLDSWTTSVLVKSRLAKGRLRVAYYDSRDTNECIGVDDNDSVYKPDEEWEDNGGGGRNTGLSKYSKVRPEGEGEATLMEPLGDQSNIWANELQQMSTRQGLQYTKKQDDGTLINPWDNENNENDSALLGAAFAGSSVGSEQKDAGNEAHEISSINPKGVDLGVGKGTFYDTPKGFNAGRNTVEIAKTGGVLDKPVSGSKPTSRAQSPSGENPFRASTSGASAMIGGETDDDNHSLSMMSDVSSGELMQRFPPTSNINNDFVNALYQGMFTDSERKNIFEPLLPEVVEVLEEAHQAYLAKQERLQRGIDERDGMNDTGEEQPNDPLYDLFSTLEHKFDTNERIQESSIEKILSILSAIKMKTDYIKERRLLRPGDFE